MLFIAYCEYSRQLSPNKMTVHLHATFLNSFNLIRNKIINIIVLFLVTDRSEAII